MKIYLLNKLMQIISLHTHDVESGFINFSSHDVNSVGGIVRGSVEVDTYLSTISYSNYKMSCILPVCSVVITIMSVQHQRKLNRMPILPV